MYAISPTQAIIAGVLFLAGVITLLWGTELRGAAGGGLEHGMAQAAAERRRLRAVSQAVRERNSGGRGISGIVSRAKETWRGMRGPRHPAAAGAVPAGSSPFSRIASATGTGMRNGARSAAAVGGAAVVTGAAAVGGLAGLLGRVTGRSRAGAGTASGGAPTSPVAAITRGQARGGPFRRFASRAAGRRTAAGGNQTGPGRKRNRRPDGTRQPRRERHMGVCDNCNGFVASGSLTEALGGELWCIPCANAHARELEPQAGPQPSAPTRPPVTPALGLTPLPAAESLPGAALPSSAPPAELPASSPVTFTAVEEGRVPAMAGAPALVIASPTGGTDMAAGIGSGRPGSALAARPGTGVIESRVAGRPGAGVAVRGDVTDHAEWVGNAKIIIQHVSAMFGFVKAMTEDMGKGECPAEAIDETAAWAETVYRYGTQILTELVQIDKNLQPWIRTIMAHGGPQNVASPRWLEGR